MDDSTLVFTPNLPGSNDPEENVRPKTRIQRVIFAADPDGVTDALEGLWSTGEFLVKAAPKTGMIMYKTLDPFDTPFFLGEVLVTTAEVVFDGQSGFGAVCGDEPERALLLASVEAVQRSGKRALPGSLRTFVDRLERIVFEQSQRDSKMAAATKVRFESMNKETVDFGSIGD